MTQGFPMTMLLAGTSFILSLIHILIFLTANDQESDQIRGYEVGAVDYLSLIHI